MAYIAALGEILIDLTQTDIAPDGTRMLAAFPGGAPANVAVAAARLGTSSAFIGKVGADSFGADLTKVLWDNNVDVTGLYTTRKAATTLAIVTVRGGERSFSFYRSPGADTLLTAEEALAPLRGDRRPVFLHLGSLSLTAEPSRSATVAALEYARANGIFVSYDPNYRAALWPNKETAVNWMLFPMAYAHMVKVSDEELPLLTGERDIAAGTEKLAACGPRLVMVTLGSEGVYYRLGSLTGTVPGYKVSVADTNGAGDTFLGAMLSRLSARSTGPFAGLTQAELESCLDYANRAAALTCTRSGAIPAMPTKEEVENGI